jgi:hypothetical protein
MDICERRVRRSGPPVALGPGHPSLETLPGLRDRARHPAVCSPRVTFPLWLDALYPQMQPVVASALPDNLCIARVEARGAPRPRCERRNFANPSLRIGSTHRRQDRGAPRAAAGRETRRPRVARSAPERPLPSPAARPGPGRAARSGRPGPAARQTGSRRPASAGTPAGSSSRGFRDDTSRRSRADTAATSHGPRPPRPPLPSADLGRKHVPDGLVRRFHARPPVAYPANPQDRPLVAATAPLFLLSCQAHSSTIAPDRGNSRKRLNHLLGEEITKE